MKKYKVLVEGVNFLIEMDSEIRKYGFFTTRFVEAWDQDEAEARVIEMLRVELKTLVQNAKSDSPMIFVEEMEELETFGEFRVPGTGFAWYPDEREGH
jgi:hypothetical protein